MSAKYVNIYCEWCGRYQQPTFVHVHTGKGFNVMARRVYVHEVSQTPQQDLLKNSPRDFRLRPRGLVLEKTRCVPPTPIGALGLELDGDGVVVLSGHRCASCTKENERQRHDLHRKKGGKLSGLGRGLLGMIKNLFGLGRGSHKTKPVRS